MPLPALLPGPTLLCLHHSKRLVTDVRVSSFTARLVAACAIKGGHSVASRYEGMRMVQWPRATGRGKSDAPVFKPSSTGQSPRPATWKRASSCQTLTKQDRDLHDRVRLTVCISYLVIEHTINRCSDTCNTTYAGSQRVIHIETYWMGRSHLRHVGHNKIQIYSHRVTSSWT